MLTTASKCKLRKQQTAHQQATISEIRTVERCDSASRLTVRWPCSLTAIREHRFTPRAEKFFGKHLIA